MQSPDKIPLPPPPRPASNQLPPGGIVRETSPEQLRTRALGAIVIATVILLLPAVAAAWFYLLRIAACNYHAMIAAFGGVL